ncbi:Protein of unknown function [Gryllus bimaculatus]|nr:Protein of unknown function [Gryllus bimaculatus]
MPHLPPPPLPPLLTAPPMPLPPQPPPPPLMKNDWVSQVTLIFFELSYKSKLRKCTSCSAFLVQNISGGRMDIVFHAYTTILVVGIFFFHFITSFFISFSACFLP